MSLRKKYRPISYSKVYFLIIFCVIFLNKINAQCISTFPYEEDFEDNPAWTSGGVNSDWTWGIPNHPLISDAGGGQRAWCIGGLNGSSYNDSQLSFLESPCFDFSELENPWISFKLFWETEFRWDGATFQYSLNNGNSWTNLGAFNDPTDCLNENWFNYNDITWITSANPRHGWTGRVGNTNGNCTGGNGSGNWRTAKHCMSELAGQSNVKFRFLFGSGNSCNDYDGFAIDDILIENTSAYNSNFTYTCLNSTNVLFDNQSVNCSQTFFWDFGDPASGNENNSTSENPMHNFSSPGTYTVILRTSGPCNEPGFSSRTITILEVESLKTDVKCFGENTGEISLITEENTNFSWNTNPIQTTSSISNLAAGNYSCEVSKLNACPLNLSFTINQPSQLNLNLSSSSSCIDFCNGSINATVSGGIQPYSYNWTHSTLNQSSFSQLCPADFSLTVVDNNLCEITGEISINSFAKPELICEDLNLCIGSSGFLTASGADTYSWSPSDGLSNTNAPTVLVNVSSPITYQLIGTSNDGCKDTLEVNVNISDVFAPVADFSYSPETIDVYDTEITFLNQSLGASENLWTFSDLDSSYEMHPFYKFPSEQAGNYLVCLSVENELSCRDTLCKLIRIEAKPSVFVPNSFTPNGDEINDYFFPVIRDISTENYEFLIFNRWGELIFATNSFSDKWNGTYQGKKVPNGIYTWSISFIHPIENELKKLSGFVELRD
jgi:gliding motility-associated-like protein